VWLALAYSPLSTRVAAAAAPEHELEAAGRMAPTRLDGCLALADRTCRGARQSTIRSDEAMTARLPQSSNAQNSNRATWSRTILVHVRPFSSHTDERKRNNSKKSQSLCSCGLKGDLQSHDRPLQTGENNTSLTARPWTGRICDAGWASLWHHPTPISAPAQPCQAATRPTHWLLRRGEGVCWFQAAHRGKKVGCSVDSLVGGSEVV
jgi:hypothetical protein